MSVQQKKSGSALARVRRFLRKLDQGVVSMEDVDRIRDDLEELLSRVERMKEQLPDDHELELSPGVGELVNKMNQTERLIDKFPNVAAGLL